MAAEEQNLLSETRWKKWLRKKPLLLLMMMTTAGKTKGHARLGPTNSRCCCLKLQAVRARCC